MDSAFDEDESELAVLVLSVPLQVLPDVDCLLNQVVEVFWELGAKSVLFEDPEDLGASDAGDLGYPVVVPQNDSNLGGGTALFSQPHNLFYEVVGGDLDPAGGSLPEW